MTETTLYVSLEVSSSSGYVSIEDVCRDKKELREKYREKERIYSKNNLNIEPFEEFKKDYIKVKVTYDGRKSQIPKERVLQELEEKGILKKVGKGGILGGYYKMSSKSSATNELIWGE